MFDRIFFSGWQPIVHTTVVALIAYPAMLVMIRLSGHRTLSKMNAFDLVVTVALGSTLASVITSHDVSLAQGLIAFLLLVVLQLLVGWVARRSRRLDAIVNGEPVLLYHRGTFLRGALGEARLTESEILAAMRSAGATRQDEVQSVVLETNGQLSVVEMPREGPAADARGGEPAGSTLRSVTRPAAIRR